MNMLVRTLYILVVHTRIIRNSTVFPWISLSICCFNVLLFSNRLKIFIILFFQGEEPAYLSVGTEVSAKYKGAFCEAKVRKVDRVVKCKVAFKQGFGSHTVLDSQIKGQLRVGAIVEARHPEKKEIIEGTITKIQDCSQYTVGKCWRLKNN